MRVRSTLLLLASAAASVCLAQRDSDESPLQWARQRLWSANSDTGPDAPFKWTWATILGAVLTCLCASLANSAGIGGGPLYMPLFNVILGFNLKSSTALSHTTVTVSAISSSLYGLYQPNPVDSRRPLIDLDLVITFLPALLLGVSIGVLGNVLLPDWLQTGLLTLLLLFVVYKTALKAYHQWDLERTMREGTEDEKSVHRGVMHEEAFHMNEHYKPPGEEQSLLEKAEQRTQAAASDAAAGLSAAWERIPKPQLGAILALWIVFLVSQRQKSKHNHCTWGYGIWCTFQVILLAAFTVAATKWEAKRVRLDPEHADPELRRMLSDDTGGKTSNMGQLSMVVFVMVMSGMCAGLLGIGGALVFNPFLLQMGVHPQVVASTAVLMILFSSSSIALSLAFDHLLNVHYALVFGPLAFVSSLFGVIVLGRIVRATGRTSIIIMLLTALIALGTLLTAVLGSRRAWIGIHHGTRAGFKPFCAVE